VSEANGSISIKVLNKNKDSGRVRVCTLDAEAKAGKDYEKFDDVVTF